MKKLSIILAAAFGFGIPFCSGELIQNGSFEASTANLFPESWKFTSKRTEKAQPQVTVEYRTTNDAAEGNRTLLFRNPINRISDVYGSIFQHIRVEPNKKYRISFLLRGENVNQLLLIMGKRWETRWTVPTGNIKPDRWKFFSHEFIAKPEEIDQNGQWMIRFNIEDFAEWGELDCVSVVPVSGEIVANAQPSTIRELPFSSGQDLFAAEFQFSGITRPADWEAVLSIVDAVGQQHNTPLKQLAALDSTNTLRLQVVIPLKIEMAPGPFVVSIKSGNDVLISKKCIHQPSGMAKEVKMLKTQLQDVKYRMKQLKKRVFHVEVGRTPSRYLALYPQIITHQLVLSERDMNRSFRSGPEREYYVLRTRIALHELKLLLDEWEGNINMAEQGIFPPNTYQTLSGKLSIKNGFQHGLTKDESGNEQERPIFFGGFGHFEQVIKDLPFLAGIGVNVIQIEVSPNDFFPQEGKEKEFEPDYTDYEQRIEKALKRAHNTGVRIALLTSTHYVPKWLIQKFQKECPEALAPGGHYLPLDPLHPRTLEMHKAFLEVLTARLAVSPYRDALQSIVIANEPAYGQCQLNREFSRKEFHKYLKKQYGSVAGFDQMAGTSFGTFDRLIKAGENHPAIKYEYNTFKWLAFANWHRFMAENIRQRLPEVPLHIKLMVTLTFAERELGWSAYDPEMLTEFFDVNGNDIGNDIWLDPAVGTELQYSLKSVMVNNTENHLFPNVYPNPVPSSRIYAAIFQQYLYGAGNLVSWVWQDNNFGGPQWCEGGIMQRPMNLYTHQRAILDANRLANEILGFIRTEPEMAILYSPTSLILNRPAYCKRLFEIYRTLAPLGYKVRFLSEKQLARKQFCNVKLLIAGETKQIRRNTVVGLQTFLKQGGKVVTVGNCFKEDEYGRKNSFNLTGTETATIDTLTTKVRRILPPLPFKLECEQVPNQQFPIHARYARLQDGRILLNLINYGQKAQTVKLDRPAKELITGKYFSQEFILPLNQPFLLEL